MTALVEARSLAKRFGALRVVDDVSLTVAPGEALGIIGPNGAGKTTLFNLLGGDYATDAGTIAFQERDVTRLAPAERARLGIGRTYQIADPFVKLTVFENALVAGTFGARRGTRDAEALAVEALRRTHLLAKANRPAGSLPLLDRKRLEVARALATDPALLLLDEIAGGLTEAEAHEVVALVQEVVAAGVAIVWIEHVVHALFAVATRLIVMADGKVFAEGEPRAVLDRPNVRSLYLGIEA
ncbi:MAG TPA: ABC transporter ATP-binding protein [Candidatus Sulfotelmatobacter sp.]|nr:ABC transporter ATP-binding protein [Candidatus Sulfotelmatobacter sp.]